MSSSLSVVVTLDHDMMQRLDAILDALQKLVTSSAEQSNYWSLSLATSADQVVGAGLGFHSKAELLGKLQDIRDAVDAGRRTEALVLIDGWVGAIETAARDDTW